MQTKVKKLLSLAREIAARDAEFHSVKGPGAGDRATSQFMQELRDRAIAEYGKDYAEARLCGENSLAVDYYFPDEETIVEIALGLPNPASEFEKDVLKALMAKELNHKVEHLLFISRPGAIKKCGQPGRSAVIEWAAAKHALKVEVQELEGKPRPSRRRRRSELA
jgi:hypothetical protein